MVRECGDVARFVAPEVDHGEETAELMGVEFPALVEVLTEEPAQVVQLLVWPQPHKAPGMFGAILPQRVISGFRASLGADFFEALDCVVYGGGNRHLVVGPQGLLDVNPDPVVPVHVDERALGAKIHDLAKSPC